MKAELYFILLQWTVSRTKYGSQETLIACLLIHAIYVCTYNWHLHLTAEALHESTRFHLKILPSSGSGPPRGNYEICPEIPFWECLNAALLDFFYFFINIHL